MAKSVCRVSLPIICVLDDKLIVAIASIIANLPESVQNLYLDCATVAKQTPMNPYPVHICPLLRKHGKNLKSLFLSCRFLVPAATRDISDRSIKISFIQIWCRIGSHPKTSCPRYPCLHLGHLIQSWRVSRSIEKGDMILLLVPALRCMFLTTRM